LRGCVALEYVEDESLYVVGDCCLPKAQIRRVTAIVSTIQGTA
jgi:hypothetical protein